MFKGLERTHMNNSKTHLYAFDAAEHSGLKNTLIRNLRDLVTYRYAIYNFIGSNLRARYRRSILGFLWTLLNPLLTMAILAVVFSTVFQSSIKNYSVYIFSGLLPWALISNSMINGSMSIVLGEAYLKKVYIPKFFFPLISVGVEVVNFLLSMISLFFLAILMGAKVNWGLLTLPIALLLTALFIFGLVLIASIITPYFRDLSHIIQLAFTALFYLTPIIYPIGKIADNHWLLTITKLNPFFYLVDLFHVIIYQAKIPDISAWLICLGLTILSLTIGSIVFNSKEKDVVYRL
jgi:ABC-type polysaccharide/polyol phosphate export permease